MKMNKQSGFTLIELVVVIIILGILAVTAAPKFLNLQSDARASTLEGLKGALQGANTLVYSKASIQGVEQDQNSTAVKNVDLDGDDTNDVATTYGYLNATKEDLTEALDVSTDDWTFATGVTGTTLTSPIVIHPADKDPAQVKCWLEYGFATDSESTLERPLYHVEDSGC